MYGLHTPTSATSTHDAEEIDVGEGQHIEHRGCERIMYTDPQGLGNDRMGCYKEEYKLHALDTCKVGVGQSMILRTNMTISPLGRMLGRKLEVVNRDTGCGGWLVNSLASVLLVKEGVISPCYRGNLGVKVLNITNRDVVVPAGSPVGIMCASKYEY